MLELDAHLQQCLPKENTFDWLLNVGGIVHRDVKHRRTVSFQAGDRRCFIKIHRPCGWGEVLKNWLSLQKPVVSARSEWEAIERLHQLGVPTMTVVGKGERGRAPAGLESFVITEALEGMISLETLARDWGGLTGANQKLLKRALLEKIAALARRLHEGGVNHRDFYLCHFLVKARDWRAWCPGDALELFVIDLHRAQLRDRVPARWLVKDLGGLLFSALDCGFTRRDLLRFVRFYRGTAWRGHLVAEKKIWTRVRHNAEKLYRNFHGQKPPSSD